MCKRETNVRELNKIFKTKIVLKILVWVSESCSVVSEWSLTWAPLSMESSRWEYRSGLLFPSPGDLSDPGIEPGLLHYRWTVYQLSHQDTTKYLYMNVYGSSILNSQKVETTQMATSRWVNDGIYRWWNFIQPLKGMKYQNTLQHGWILKTFLLSERNQTQKVIFYMI